MSDGPPSPEPGAPPPGEPSREPGREPKRAGGPNDLELLEGTSERTVFHSADSGYTVLRANIEGEIGLVAVVGLCGGIEDGADFSAHGRWVVHPKHGRQFKFETIKLRQPTSEIQVIARLKTYPGIKDVMAERIVKRFGLDTLEILDRQPKRLLEVSGLGQKTLTGISDHHAQHRGPMADLQNRLLELDASPRHAEGLRKRYGDQAMAMLEHHPYRLAREVRGIGFSTADRIARALGVDLDSDERVDAGLVHTLERAKSEGHCALPPGQLIAEARRILSLPSERLDAGVDRLIREGALISRLMPSRDADQGAPSELYFLSRLDQAEDNLVETLLELACTPRGSWEVGELPEHLSPGQRAAVEAIAECGVAILTGGPGTGKSTVVANVIEVAKRAGEALLLAAPTGRAAKRLEQTTGESAKTVHRLLEYQPESHDFSFCANNPLPDGLVVIDESSMLDLELAESLITALTPLNRLLLVGDADQLPSVGPGNVLRDLINAAERAQDSPIPVVRLDTIFRQQSGSTIVDNAHRVLHGQSLASDQASRGSEGEFFFLRAGDAERTHQKIVEMAAERIPAAFGFDPISEIQVLCPMHKGRAGTEAFNLALQQVYTGDKEGIEAPGARSGEGLVFRLGDRVMQIRNDYDRNVFNGDIGVVSRIVANLGTLTVDYEGHAATYERHELGALRLAYAISIHKSQGSEFPAVLIPMLGEHHVMLRRNLLYTAMTRARRLCVIVGEERAIQRAISRADAARRWTGLCERTLALLDEL